MAVLLCTLTGNIGDIAGAPATTRSGSTTIRNARIETNIPDGEFVVAGDQIRLGSRPIDISADGTFTEQGLLRSDSPDTSVAAGTLQYRVTFDARGESYASTWFTLTRATESLANVEDSQALSVSFVTQATSDFKAFADGERQRVADEADRAADEADRAASIAGIDTTDDAVDVVLKTPGGKAAATVSAAVASSAAGAMQETLGRIRGNTRDVNILIVSDSTAAGSADGSWTDGLIAGLHDLFRTHNISYRKWLDGSSVYSPATTTPGTGPRTINVWNGSVAGQTWQYGIDATRRTTLAVAPNPDLIMFCHGHNESNTDASSDFGVDGKLRDRAVAAVETIRTLVPAAAVVLISQNPLTSWPGNSERRADMYRRLSRERGWGFIDACQAFRDDGRNVATQLVTADNVHPTAAGYAVWAAAVLAAFSATKPVQPSPTLPAAFAAGRANLVTNGNFDDFTAPPTLPGWTASNATLSKDAVNVETKAYSVKIAKAAGGAASFAATTVAVPALLRGREVTIAVRMFIAAGQPGTAGQVALADGAIKSSALWTLRDQWFWQTLTVPVDPNAGSINVRVYADPAPSQTLTEVSVDRVIVVPGRVPADLYAPAPAVSGAFSTDVTVSGTGVLARFSNTTPLTASNGVSGVFVGRRADDVLQPALVLAISDDAKKAIIENRSGVVRVIAGTTVPLQVGSDTVGFHGIAPTARQALAAAGTDAASTQTLVNDIRAKLIAKGLMS